MSLIDIIEESTLWQMFLRLLWWKKLLVMGVLFLAFVLTFDLFILPWFTRHGQEYKLPDVTSKDVYQAKKVLKKYEFIPIIQDSTYDSFYKPGMVLRQNPSAFSTVKKGRRVYLTISSGEKPVMVPNLIGMTIKDAQFKIREVGLKLNQIHKKYSQRQPYAGTVINQSLPSVKQVIQKNIDLTISLGAPPSSKTMPLLRGKSLEIARKELQALNIQVGRIEYQKNTRLVPNTIINQSIPAGTSLKNNMLIDLVVSTDRFLDDSNQDYNQ